MNETKPAGMGLGDAAPARFVLAFDTANEVIAIGLGSIEAVSRSLNLVAHEEVEARRQSNTQLIPRIDALLERAGVARDAIACVAVGRGPGSFTGVRIAMATAKGIASALEVGLVGVSSLDAVAWGVWESGERGDVAVVADAMRKEVYPVRYLVEDEGVRRLEVDRVAKADVAAGELRGVGGEASGVLVAGDGLKKYRELFEPCGRILSESVWAPSGQGLLLALQAMWRAGECDPLDARRHDPALALPVYTRLSDAEENERARVAASGAREDAAKNLRTGVQDASAVEHPSLAHAAQGVYVDGSPAHHRTLHEQSILVAPPDDQGISYKPLDAAHAADVAAMESAIMGSDAWNASLVADELPRKDRVWWMALASDGKPGETGTLIGYAGGWVVDGDVQILKVGTDRAWRRRGIARELLSRVAADARNLGARTASLEVRVSNTGARALYAALGMSSLGVRPRYYSDGEDACIMKGELAGLLQASGVSAVQTHEVAGMELQVDAAHDAQARLGANGVARPLILAIESSCDETAAAVVDGEGHLASDVVASQIDFHARFGGVVPEIASRKHIEAICGVCDECLDVAARDLGVSRLRFSDLSAIAVTYAPGLVGALVVGVAFAKGAAWAAGIPFIGVNHLEGHLYANRIGFPDFEPPAVVSLVSGGNTLLVHMKGWGDYKTLGSTIDDAVGEAFDKVAKALGLGYPGGPVISRLGAKGDPKAIPFPRAMLHSGDLRFSLSGLKTAVITYINGEREAGRDLNVPDICASFEAAVVDVQVAKAKRALEMTGARTLCVGGGVAANPVLRAAYEKMCGRAGVRLVLPPLSACGDNAGMIALVALDRFSEGKFFPLSTDAKAHANLDDPY